MALPRETGKEVVVIVDNDSLEVVISPPVIDSAIVVGQPPPADSRTLLFNGFVNDSMRVLTQGGLNFELSNTALVPADWQSQIMVSHGAPVDGPYMNHQIYIDTFNKSFYVYSGSVDDWPNPQVVVADLSSELSHTEVGKIALIVENDVSGTNLPAIWEFS